MALSDEDKDALLDTARMAIATYMVEKKVPVLKSDSEALRSQSGAFVSLHKAGDLRGCIGVFTSSDPLYKTIAIMAISAAFEDPRFPPLTEQEVKDIDIEISILSPLKRITDVEDIEVGKHGIYIIKGVKKGVLLPQVAVEFNLDRHQFLDHTCLKAGLPTGAWKQGAEIYTFTAEIFNDHIDGSEVAPQ